MEPAEKSKSVRSMYIAPLLAGALAGVSVDVALYPLDTLKTRLQSKQGFQKAGGFKGVYKGLTTVAVSSMPTTALFFVSYETTKSLLQPHISTVYAPFVNMFAAGVGEVLACVIRVPTEIAKQRKQTYVGTKKRSSISILIDAYRAEGIRKGVYRGFFSTVARDLPFSFIELPVWEMLKTVVSDHNDGKINTLQSALCGSVAGGFAAGITTPLDVAKTRIMLAKTASGDNEYRPCVHTGDLNIKGRCEGRSLQLASVLLSLYSEGGWSRLFAGALPRTAAFMLGGLVFFGVYDDVKGIIETKLDR